MIGKGLKITLRVTFLSQFRVTFWPLCIIPPCSSSTRRKRNTNTNLFHQIFPVEYSGHSLWPQGPATDGKCTETENGRKMAGPSGGRVPKWARRGWQMAGQVEIGRFLHVWPFARPFFGHFQFQARFPSVAGVRGCKTFSMTLI